ncbi:hypothetical protein KJ633_07465 [bacterium]|nr:hypothetical protein [bacterium]
MFKNEKEQSNPEVKQGLGGESKKDNRNLFKRIIFILAGLVIIALIFNAGMLVIGIKTHFLDRWTEGYYFGEIIKIDDNGFVIKGRGDMEKIVLIRESTVIKKGKETVEDALQIGNQVIVIGSLDEGERIEAKIIRIFDSDKFEDLQKSLRFRLFK